MSKTIRIAYATTAEESLVSQVHHLAPYHGAVQAQAKLVELIKTVERRLKAHPLAAPVCQQAALLGVTQYQEVVKKLSPTATVSRRPLLTLRYVKSRVI